MISISELAQRLGLPCRGDGSVSVAGIATLRDATERDLSFVVDRTYAEDWRRSPAAAAVVGPDFEPVGDIGVQQIDGGEFAATTHFGPYNELGKTYVELLGRWLPGSGREAASRPCLEFYLNDPEGTDPEDLVTDIFVPLQPVEEE